MLTTLLFDVDGTLAETEEVHRQSFNEAFSRDGLDWVWSRDQYKELLGVTGGKERIRHFIKTYSPEYPEYIEPENFDEYIAGLHASKTEIYTQTVGEGKVALRPGVVRLLNEARARSMRLGIATTTTPANVTSLLEHSLGSESLDWFEVIAAGGVVPNKKPAPDIFNYAMDKMDVKPDECLALEDSENGLRSSLGAGITTLVTVSQYTQGQDFSGAAVVLDNLGEPDAPFSPVSGIVGKQSFVDIDFLHGLCK